ncbi:DUF2007 domain-containing protein [Aureisphaera galaxeae]|uniref:putative signal transducing protein n=1 Tax=Aureisphaera galaxeae TaxID=1538023 RepID=UPI0023508316|nr:DUF2007 domain-containing protein [Aureisphaera galaxeae]MDC8002691.1 DUF2007 domain-containing protein [Aureisphaera galaxeae]
MNKTFETVARFTYPSEAQIVKGRLESEGIPAFIVDHNAINVDPLVVSGSGGVKLNVYVEDKERALKIMSEIKPFSLDDEGMAIQCPDCGSDEIEFFSNAREHASFIGSLAQLLFGRFTKKSAYDYRCKSCKYKFLLP